MPALKTNIEQKWGRQQFFECTFTKGRDVVLVGERVHSNCDKCSASGAGFSVKASFGFNVAMPFFGVEPFELKLKVDWVVLMEFNNVHAGSLRTYKQL